MGRGATQRDDVADLQRLLAHDNLLDEQLQDRLPLGEGGRVEPFADPRAERRQIGEHLLGAGGLLLLPLPPGLLALERLALRLEPLATLAQFVQRDDLRLVGIGEAPLLPGEARQLGRRQVGLGRRLRPAARLVGGLLELRQ